MSSEPGGVDVGGEMASRRGRCAGALGARAPDHRGTATQPLATQPGLIVGPSMPGSGRGLLDLRGLDVVVHHHVGRATSTPWRRRVKVSSAAASPVRVISTASDSR